MELTASALADQELQQQQPEEERPPQQPQAADIQEPVARERNEPDAARDVQPAAEESQQLPEESTSAMAGEDEALSPRVKMFKELRRHVPGAEEAGMTQRAAPCRPALWSLIPARFTEASEPLSRSHKRGAALPRGRQLAPALRTSSRRLVRDLQRAPLARLDSVTSRRLRFRVNASRAGPDPDTARQ